jgi:hypothetical protein
MSNSNQTTAIHENCYLCGKEVGFNFYMVANPLLNTGGQYDRCGCQAFVPLCEECFEKNKERDT